MPVPINLICTNTNRIGMAARSILPGTKGIRHDVFFSNSKFCSRCFIVRTRCDTLCMFRRILIRFR